jgi:hypothetical protein
MSEKYSRIFPDSMAPFSVAYSSDDGMLIL